MVSNAFELDQHVKIWLEGVGSFLDFCVWNDHVIPDEVAPGIFQRNFTTKEEDGRRIGTYSMKLFREKLPGKKINFTSSEKEGTTFRFSLSM